MKIYRYIPNTADFGMVSRPVTRRWWPTNIDLGWDMDLSFKYSPALENNSKHVMSYYHDPDNLPLSDFPALTLNLPIISHKALSAIQAAGIKLQVEPVLIGDRKFFAVQSQDLPLVFNFEKSKGLKFPNGDVFYFYHRMFNEAEVRNEFFTIPKLCCSDIYITERIIKICQDANLTGLEYVELVFDGAPIEPHYKPQHKEEMDVFTARAQLERDLIAWRCSAMNYTQPEIDRAVEDAVSKGYISYKDNLAAYG